MLRLCILNHSTSQAEVDRALELAATLAVDLPAPPAGAAARATRHSTQGGSADRSSTRTALRSLRCSRRSTTPRLTASWRSAREQHAAAGEAIVEQWQVSRDLYVILDGAVADHGRRQAPDVLGAGRLLRRARRDRLGRRLRPHAHGDGHRDTATRLLVLDWMLVNALMKADPAFAEFLEQTARRRLAND